MAQDEVKVEVGPCRGPNCDAILLWVKTEDGRRIPIDSTPKKGMYIMTDVEGRVKKVTVYTNHFATCPDAESFRKKRRKKS